MLSKLMKHELKATSRLLVPLYMILLLVAIVNRFILNLNIREGIFLFFTGFLTITQIVLIIAIIITTVLLMIIRFYKNLLSNEGYLMFTLPVNSHQLIISKLLITLFWVFVGIVIVLSALSITFITSNNIELIVHEIQRIFADLKMFFPGKTTSMFIQLILLILISAVTNILMIYASIAIGQIFSKHKIIASFVAYAIIYNVIQIVMLAALVILSLIVSGSINFTKLLLNVAFPIGIVLDLIICTIFYIITNYIFERKLNLE